VPALVRFQSSLPCSLSSSLLSFFASTLFPFLLHFFFFPFSSASLHRLAFPGPFPSGFSFGKMRQPFDANTTYSMFP
jgi:hypothetical protein